MLAIIIVIIGTFIWYEINNCKTELRYNNTLLEEQNELLQNELLKDK